LPQFTEFMALLEASGSFGALRDQIIENIGPRYIGVVAADFASDDMLPMAGVLLESVNAADVVVAMTQLAEDVVRARNERADLGAYVAQHDVLGVTVHEVHLGSGVVDEATFASLIASDLTPSFAALDGWVLVGSSPVFIRQVLEARFGIGPNLASVLNVRRLRPQFRRCPSAVLTQPAFTLGLVSHWRRLLESQRAAVRGKARLGISVANDGDSGGVRVTTVNSNGAAHGILQPDDLIIACNGVLLDHDQPDSHLRRLLATIETQRPVELHIVRDCTPAPVTVTPVGIDGSKNAVDTMDAMLDRLQPVTSLMSELVLAGLAVERPVGGHYRAHFVFEFERDQPGEQWHVETEPSPE
jgi:hypothetical protein